MQHETTLIYSPLPNTYAILTTTTGVAARNNSAATQINSAAPQVSEDPVRGLKPQTRRVNHSHESLTHAFELLLGNLRGEALVAAMLAYGLGVCISDLRTLRVRDVCLKDKSIFVTGHYQRVPDLALDDLREHLHGRICGREAPAAHNNGNSEHLWRREDLLFSAHAFATLRRIADVVNRQTGATVDPRFARSFDSSFDSAFKLLGRLHRRRAGQYGVLCKSPLELFDKGPRIVRRKRGGAIDAYYVWRAARELF